MKRNTCDSLVDGIILIIVDYLSIMGKFLHCETYIALASILPNPHVEKVFQFPIENRC
jgi:hypothetical protein